MYSNILLKVKLDIDGISWIGQAKEEAELPEYILGTVRLNRVKLDSAVPLEVWDTFTRWHAWIIDFAEAMAS